MFTKKRSAVTTARGSQQAASAAKREVYLRRDIGSGVIGCEESSSAAHADYEPILDKDLPILIPDTNIVLHNINALEDERIVNVVFLSTVLVEAQNRNKSVYTRINKLMADKSKKCYAFPNDRHEFTHCKRGEDETINDFNDRQIRVAARWYARREILKNTKVYLVTHDQNLRQRAADEAAANATANAAGDDSTSTREAICVGLREFVGDVMGTESDLMEKLEHVIPDGMKESPNGPERFAEHLPVAEATRRVELGELLKGKFRVSDSSCFFGEIRGKWKDRKFERLLIGGRKNCNRALHDDIIAVTVLPVGEWRPKSKKEVADGSLTEEEAFEKGYTPCGAVVSILEPRRRPYCGSIDMADVEKATGLTGAVNVTFQPKNPKIPKIKLRTSQLEYLKDKRISVVIDDWPAHLMSPLGHYVEVLGPIGDKDTEAKVILIEHDIPHYDFSQAVYDCLPKGEWRVENSEVQKRLDLRNLCVVSVDPLGCKDIDDALHCRKLPNGNIEVGVHIADVTHFMTEDTPMDEEAAKRSTSVYLVDRRINMLPQLLTENLCSIVGKEERYAFSVIWEFDSNYNVLRDWYGKTIIRSSAALYYGDAQKMIDDPNDNSEIATSLKGLMDISKYLKDQRCKAGALFLASQEFKFKVDNDHVNPTDMVTYATFEANSMIEEWMLFANAAVAMKIHSVFPRWALLRRHQPPAEASFEALNEALDAKIGLKLNPTTSLALNETLDAAVDPNDSFFNKLVRMLCTRCLRQAEYFSSGEVPVEEFRHFGLAMPIYTHFTSPIRRYADVIVHRQLMAAIGIADVSENHTNVEKINAIAGNINYRHEQAQKAGRDSQNLFTGFFLRNFQDSAIPLEWGYVVRVSDTHVSVLVPKYGQEGQVALEDLTKPYRMLDRVVVKLALRQGKDVLATHLTYGIEEDEEAISQFASEMAEKEARTNDKAQMPAQRKRQEA